MANVRIVDPTPTSARERLNPVAMMVSSSLYKQELPWKIKLEKKLTKVTKTGRIVISWRVSLISGDHDAGFETSRN